MFRDLFDEQFLDGVLCREFLHLTAGVAGDEEVVHLLGDGGTFAEREAHLVVFQTERTGKVRELVTELKYLGVNGEELIALIREEEAK